MRSLHQAVIPKERLQRPHGVEVIDLDGDGTAAVISVSLESDQIMNSLASQKSEVRLFSIMLR